MEGKKREIKKTPMTDKGPDFALCRLHIPRLMCLHNLFPPRPSELLNSVLAPGYCTSLRFPGNDPVIF